MAAMAASGSLGREGGLSAERPVLVDRFLEDAIEVDVDAVRDCDGGDADRRGHGARGGGRGPFRRQRLRHPAPDADARRSSPTIEGHTRAIADALGVQGPFNVQFAVAPRPGGPEVHVIEANPRASRTVPFVSKATGVPLARVAARVMLGATLAELRLEGLVRPPAAGGHVSVKEAVLPFNRFPDADTVLGPEMRSTGEVMGIDTTLRPGLRQEPGRGREPAADRRPGAVHPRRPGQGGGAGGGPAVRPPRLLPGRHVRHRGIPRGGRDPRPDPGGQGQRRGDAGTSRRAGTAAGADSVELIRSGQVQLVVNTPRGRGPRADGAHIRRAAMEHKVACLTTLAAARAAAAGIAERARGSGPLAVRSLQELHAVDQLPLDD